MRTEESSARSASESKRVDTYTGVCAQCGVLFLVSFQIRCLRFLVNGFGTMGPDFWKPLQTGGEAVA